MKKLTIIFAITGFSIILSPSSKAGGIPVIDLSNLTQAIIDYGQQYSQIVNQVDQIRNQIQQIQQLAEQYEQQLKSYQSMTGSYGMSDLLNGTLEKELRDYIPGDWEEIYQAANGGTLSGHQSEVSEAIKNTQEFGQAYSSNDLFLDESSIIRDRFEFDVAQTYAGLGVSTTTFNNTTQRTKQIEQLVDQIDIAHDPKAAMDLQVRMQAETSFLVNEMVRQQSLANMIMARSQERELNRRSIELKKVRNLTFPEIK